MVYIPTFPEQTQGIRNLIVGRGLDPDSSADEFSALTCFLGYLLSYFLGGILFVQVFTYYFSFRQTDPCWLKIFVFVICLVECASTVCATVLVISSLIIKGYLSYSLLDPGFQAVAILNGIASSMIHAFYCWRIRVLRGPWAIIVFIMMLSLVQCIMVLISGFGGFSGGDILGAEISSYVDSSLLDINVLWLSVSAVCDIIITSTILYLQNRIMKDSGSSNPLTTRVKSVVIHTGMITAIGALIELLLYLTLRNTLVHFILFYAQPKLYANCAMAALNARSAAPGKCFQEYVNGEFTGEEAVSQTKSTTDRKIWRIFKTESDD
ncbi:hypothetical protein GYMLUDRAFT_68084 [Collybiopsis luxurians FD-317 M1]|nr:hypothetical protein GYMLUDRAFT_68084 [Collybiopsis luxurians FD-317 M1]